MAAGGDGKGILEEADVIVFEPDFAEFVGSFESDVVSFHRTGAQGGEPHAEGVLAQLGAQLFLRQSPNFFCRKLHVFSVKGLYSKRFIHYPKKPGPTPV